MTTTYTTTVKPSGGDYTSLSAWEAGFGSNTGSHNGGLVAADIIEKADCYAMVDTSLVYIDGWTTDATRYIHIYVPVSERHDGKYNTSKYRLEATSQNQYLIDCVESYIRIEGIQLEATATSGSARAMLFRSTCVDVWVSHCILKGVLSGTSVGQGIYYYGSANLYVWNCIAYDWVNGTNDFAAFAYEGGGVGYFYSNTVQNCYKGFANITGSASKFLAKNCLAQDCTDGFVGSFNASSTNNCSDIASDAPGANPQTGEVLFVDEANDDFHLSVSDTVAKDNGIDTSGDASPFNFTDDIDGETRSGTWDIGADEYVAGGGSALLKIYNEAVNSTSANPRLMAMRRPVGEAQQINEGSLRAFGLRRIVNSSISLVEGVLRSRGLARIVNSSISLVEGVLRVSGLKRIVNATISVGENTLGFLSSVMIKVLSSTIQIAEAVTRRSGLARIVNSSISLVEGVLRNRGLARIVNSSISLVEGVLRNRGLARIVGMIVSAGELLGKASSLIRVANSSLSIAETATHIQGFVKVISDSISISVAVLYKKTADTIGSLSENLTILFTSVARKVISKTSKKEVQ